MAYKIEFVPRALKELAAIPETDQTRIAKRIDALAENPRPPQCRKLRGAEDVFRIRSGDYRVIYVVADKVVTVTVVRVGHRRDIYE